jgi:hypothetical protein
MAAAPCSPRCGHGNAIPARRFRRQRRHRDRAEWREKARAKLVEWFDVCTDAEAVNRRRRYLSMYLN